MSRLLQSRRGWSLEPQTTPGAPPTWCFGSGGESELSVSVDGGTVCAYLIDNDQEITLEDTEALTAWLDTYEPLFSRRASMTSEVFDELLLRTIDEWRHQGY